MSSFCTLSHDTFIFGTRRTLMFVYATMYQAELPTISYPAEWSSIFGECPNACPHSSGVPSLETRGCYLQIVMHPYNRSTKM